MVRDILAIIAMLACTSICLGNGNTITINFALAPVDGVFPDVAGNSANPNGTVPFSQNPNNNTLIIKKGASVGQASGTRINAGSNSTSMTGNKIIVNGGNFNGKNINGACALTVGHDVNVNGNTVEINAGENIENVFGGCVDGNGNAKNNKVIINGVRVGVNVIGGFVGGNGNAKNNKVIINGVRVGVNVIGGVVAKNDNGNATGNRVTIAGTSEFGDETVLCGGDCTGEGSDAFTDNTLIIKETKGITVKGISNFENYEFCLSEVKPQEPVLTARDGGRSWDKNKRNGDGTFGGYSDPCQVKLSRNNITVCSKVVIEKGTKHILIRSLQGFDVTSKECKSKSTGPVVYKWDLKIVDSKDLATSSSNSSRGSESGSSSSSSPSSYSSSSSSSSSTSSGYGSESESSSSSSSSSYSSSSSSCSSSSRSSSSSDSDNEPEDWSSKDLVATLAQKSIAPETVALCKGHGTGILLVNDGLDSILKTMEDSRKGKTQREERLKEGLPDKPKGHVEAFIGTSRGRLNYKTDNTNSQKIQTNSVVTGARITLELGGKDLTAAVFGEFATATNKIKCYKDSSNATSKYAAAGLFAKYDFYESESIGQKIYGELVLKAGQATNGFEGTINNEEVKYKDLKNMYEGFELGIGNKHKINKDIKLEENLRYMLTYGNKKDQELIRRRTIEFDSVMSSRLKIGVKGTYTGIKTLDPYLRLWYEQELDGKIKAEIQDGADKLSGIESMDSKGPTLTTELGASAKIWKLDLDLSGQGYIGKKAVFWGH